MLKSPSITALLLSMAAIAYGQGAPRLVPSSDVYAGTLGMSAAPKVLSGKGTMTAAPLPGGSLLGRDAVRLQIDAGNAAAEFWLPADVKLPADVQRVSFWALSRGIAWSETRAVLQDPKGVVRTYKAQAVGDSPWTLYHIPMRNPGAAVTEFQTVKGDGLWHFRGLTLRYQPFAKGGITLGEILTSTKTIPTGLPDESWSFRDIDESLVHQAAYSGFRFSYEATTLPVNVPLGLLTSPARPATTLQWQLRTQAGETIDTGTLDVTKTPARNPLDSDFVLPTVPAGNYWLRVKLRGAADELLTEYESSYLVHRSQAAAAVTALSDKQHFDHFWPALAEVNIDTAAASPKPLAVQMADVKAGDTVEWTWLDSTSQPLGTGSETVTGVEAALTVAPPASTLVGPQRYQVRLRLKRGNVLVDQRIANVYANADAAPFTAGTANPERYFTLKETDMRSIRVDQQAGGNEFIQNAANNHSQAFLTFYWDEIEPRKNFLQFVPMDDRIARAVKAGVGVMPTLAVHLDRLPRWLWYPVMLDQGLQSRHYNASFTRKPSPASKEVRDALADTARAIVRHYKDSPAIVGWNFTQGVESFWSDASRNGFVVDFSRTASLAFADYLKAAGWTPETVSTGLGRRVTGWDDVTPPQPIFDGQLDLRPLWLAWEGFKQKVPLDNFDALLSAVRSEDPKRPIFIYAGMGAGDLAAYTGPFLKYHGTICFGGGDAPISSYLESLALNAGVDFDAESAAVPPFEPQLLTTIFHKLSHGSTHGGTNIMWGRFFSAGSADHVNGSRSAAKWVDVINRIGPSAPVWADVAVGVGSQSVINRTRSSMWIDWMNLSSQSYHFSDMIVNTIGGNAQVGYVTDHTPLDRLAQFPAIVFQESPLLSDSAARRLNDYVRNGGTLVLQGDTGHYDENGKDSATLRGLLNVDRDGLLHTLGRGRVRWLATPAEWKKPDSLKELAGDIGYAPPTTVDRTDVMHALRKATDGDARFLVLFRKTWPTGNPKIEQLGSDVEVVKAAVHALPPGKRWVLTNLVDNTSLGEQTTDQLAGGFDLRMKPADMMLIRLDPK